jgi:hypothetical protein
MSSVHIKAIVFRHTDNFTVLVAAHGPLRGLTFFPSTEGNERLIIKYRTKVDLFLAMAIRNNIAGHAKYYCRDT